MDKNFQQIDELDCAVCLQKCHYPTQLPCGHIFCFLCLKGVAVTTKKCAMCRAPIPSDYLNHPDVLTIEVKETGDYQWYYEGGNGWWKYEDRHNSELENCYLKGDSQCKLLIAGELYCIDFQKMMQFRIRDSSRRRRVRRDTPSMPAKGIAGIKIGNTLQPNNKDEQSVNQTNISVPVNVINVPEDTSNVAQRSNRNLRRFYNNDISNLLQRFREVGLRDALHDNDSSENEN